MIIGFDGSRAFSANRTGTENYSYQLLKALARLAESAKRAKIDRKNQYIVYLRPNTVILSKTKDLDSSPNFQFKIINWPRLWTQGGLALATFKDKLDVLFVPSHTLPLIRKPGLKTVVTVHDLGSEYLPSMHQLKQRLYLGLMQKFQLKTASKIIAVSNATKQDLIKKLNIPSVIPAKAGIYTNNTGSRVKPGMTQEDIKVIYEGYDKSLYRKLPIDIIVNRLRQYNLKPQTYYLFVGTVQPRKNLERVIRAYERVVSSKYQVLSTKSLNTNYILPTTNLVIAGAKGWLSDEIYALPKKLGIEDRVKFLGYVPEQDLPALYGGAIAFVYPSLFEGFGLPILEAQACGCPVITSNISSMPEVSGEGALLVNPYNIEEIAGAMISSKQQVVSSKLIKKGFENIKRFSWEKCAKETLAVLNKL